MGLTKQGASAVDRPRGVQGGEAVPAAWLRSVMSRASSTERGSGCGRSGPRFPPADLTPCPNRRAGSGRRLRPASARGQDTSRTARWRAVPETRKGRDEKSAFGSGDGSRGLRDAGEPFFSASPPKRVPRRPASLLLQGHASGAASARGDRQAAQVIVRRQEWLNRTWARARNIGVRQFLNCKHCRKGEATNGMILACWSIELLEKSHGGGGE